MENKHILKIDMVLIVGSVIVMIFLVGYARPLVIAPIDEYATTSTSILFEIENADKILIDDNLEFTSPEEYVVQEGAKINLKPGEYYWKAVGSVGVLRTEVRRLTIQSEVDLRLRRLDSAGAGDERFGVFNAGNVGLNVDVYDGVELVESVKLDVDGVALEGSDGREFSEGDKFVGSQDG